MPIEEVAALLDDGRGISGLVDRKLNISRMVLLEAECGHSLEGSPRKSL